VPHLHLGFPLDGAEGIFANWCRCTLLVLAITIHNIPEGLAVGITVGALAFDLPSTTIGGAVGRPCIRYWFTEFPGGCCCLRPLANRRAVASEKLLVWSVSGIS